jgi:glyoxylase-like metal-dependent hydrolase (beta-lactamase superfamily II)
VPEDAATPEVSAASARQVAPGVFVFTAGLYTTTTTVVAGADGGCLVIDPAITPADLAALEEWLTLHGLRPVAGWSTHPHWDHVLWSETLGADVPRYATPAAVAVAARDRDTLAREAEGEEPGHDLALFGRLTAVEGVPEPVAGTVSVASAVSVGTVSVGTVPWDGPEARVIAHDAHAPGHGALFLPDTGVLIAGDMLSDIEIPLLDTESPDPFGAYRMGLARLASLPGVRVVVPGHGHPADRAGFRSRVAADFVYLDGVETGTGGADPRLGADTEPGSATERLRQEHTRQVALAQPGLSRYRGASDTMAHFAIGRAAGAPGVAPGLTPLLQDEDRNEPVGPLLVFGVRRVGSDRALPPGSAFLAADLAGGRLPLVRAVLDLNVRVGEEVVVPQRVLRRAALGRDSEVGTLVLDAHQRGLADLAGLGAAVRDDDDRHARVPQRRPLGAAAALVFFHLSPDPFGRARFVFTVNSHVTIQHQQPFG